ncbi:hypothetical protein GCM10012289_52200 [Nonomuraea cavernae]|uniref:Uncharacterized protein n=1 Tax=Nonomuraea cavernae TaxID=2045107 RepID=A0A918DN00_9ACTN|nr:hypothetical protein GCM10012289_52200 [Nonomuraea cavernae]
MRFGWGILTDAPKAPIFCICRLGAFGASDTFNFRSALTETADWVAVRDGRVYDAFTPRGGETTAEYKAQWDYSDAIDFGF